MAITGRRILFPYALCSAVLLGVFLLFTPTHAATITKHRANELQVGTDSAQRVTLFDGKFKGGATVAAGDLDGDGVDEYLVGAGSTGGPQVQVYGHDLGLIRNFFAYDTSMKDGINVAVGDINGDGVAEIVVAPQVGHTPNVRIFSATGALQKEFTVFEPNYTGGINVAVIPSRNWQAGYIVVGSNFAREGEVRVYDNRGKSVVASWQPFGKNPSNGVTVAGGWSTAYNQDVVVVGAGVGQQPKVQVYGLVSKVKLDEWLAYDQNVKTGIAVAYRNDVVVTGPSVGGAADIKTFSSDGTQLDRFVAFEKEFRGGVNVAATLISDVVTPLVVPTALPTTGAGQGKSILVSLSKQTLTMFEHGRIVSVRRISTGKWSTPTPTGVYKTYNKIPIAYSRAYGLYMENWMAFQPDGSMGLHSLPFWKLKNGGRLYEGANHIGTPVSHGCIRQTLADSKTLYDWTPIGTPVVIVK